MEDESARKLNAPKETNTRKEVVESPVMPDPKEQIHTIDSKSNNDPSDGDEPPYGEFNMEAAMSSDDITRAGGFGARDEIGSFLPVASDSTDFEASLIDARGYEEPQKERERPGLGYNK